MRFSTSTLVALTAAVLALSSIVRATVPEAEGCPVFTDSLSAWSITLASTSASGSLAKGGFTLTLNEYVIPRGVDVIAIETSMLYNILVIPAEGSTSNFTTGLIRVATTASNGTASLVLQPGIHGQDASCTASWLGVSTTTDMPVKTEMGAGLVTYADGIVSVDVTIMDSNLFLYTSKYTLETGVVIPDFPTITPHRVSASPTASPAPTPAHSIVALSDDVIVTTYDTSNGTASPEPDNATAAPTPLVNGLNESNAVQSDEANAVQSTEPSQTNSQATPYLGHSGRLVLIMAVALWCGC